MLQLFCGKKAIHYMEGWATFSRKGGSFALGISKVTKVVWQITKSSSHVKDNSCRNINRGKNIIL